MRITQLANLMCQKWKRLCQRYVSRRGISGLGSTPQTGMSALRNEGAAALVVAAVLAWSVPLAARAAEPAPGADAPMQLAYAPRAQESSAARSSTTNETVRAAWEFFTGTNATPAKVGAAKQTEDFQTRLRIARSHRLARQFTEATAGYAGLLEGGAPEPLQRTALLDLAQMAQEQNDLPRAQQVYAQWLLRWPTDPGVPEVLLRQGLVYRRMGLYARAVAKFYAVMTSALVLKPERFEYYQQLVLRAQNEIAETHYDLGEYAEAVESFGRLLKLDCPPMNRSAIQYRYIQCLNALGRRGEAIGQAQDYLERYADAHERAEVHSLCAMALKQSGRNADALRQVVALLQEQQGATNGDPATLAYWQRRAGNEIANQFYQEGDSMKALDIYLRLATLDSAPEWQFPVWYQVGLLYERLNQPVKAAEYYGNIAKREKEFPTNASPSLRAVLDMAKWRKDFLGWQHQTELANLVLRSAAGGQPSQTNSLPLPAERSPL